MVHEIEDALRIAERSSDDFAVIFVRATLAVALAHRPRLPSVTADSSSWPRPVKCSYAAIPLSELPLVNVYLARERARHGDRDDAIRLMRAAVDHLFREERLQGWGIPATGVLVETLLDRGEAADVAEAEAAIERLATAPADEGLVIREIWLLRLRALLQGPMARTLPIPTSRPLPRHGEILGFEGHIAWAEAMP